MAAKSTPTSTTKSTPTPTPVASAPLTSQLGLWLATNQTNAQNAQNAPVAWTWLSTGYTPVTVAPAGTTKNVQTGETFENTTTGPYTYQNAQAQWYTAPKGVVSGVPETTTQKDYTPTGWSLGYFIQQAGWDRAKGLEMYKKAQDEKPKAIITPLSDRQKEEDALNSGSGSAPTNTWVKPTSTTQKNTTPTVTTPGDTANPTPTVVPPTTTPPVVPPTTDKKTTVPPPATPYTDKKTVAYWTAQGDDYKTAVSKAKAERATVAAEKKQNTTLDLRDSTKNDEPIVDAFLDTKKIISDTDKANKTEEEKMLIKDKEDEFTAKDSELQKEIDDQISYTNQRITELDKSGTEFESNRLNQVRSAILQKLAAKGINIADIPADQLLALSWDLGVVAFKDVYDKKEEIKQKISTLEKDKMTSLNDLRSRKVLNESQYNSALTTIKASADAERNKIDENFNTTAYNALFANKQNDIAQGNTLASNINALLTQYGVSAQFAGDFQSVLGAKTVAEAQAKITQILKDKPDLAKKLDEAKKAASASAVTSAANLGLNISKEEFDRKQALYSMQEKTINDDKTLTTQQKTEKKTSLYNSIFWTTWGGSSATSSPWL